MDEEESLNYDHAMAVYDSVVNNDPNVTKDFGQLYMTIKVLGDKLQEYSKIINSLP